MADIQTHIDISEKYEKEANEALRQAAMWRVGTPSHKAAMDRAQVNASLSLQHAMLAKSQWLRINGIEE